MTTVYTDGNVWWTGDPRGATTTYIVLIESPTEAVIRLREPGSRSRA